MRRLALVVLVLVVALAHRWLLAPAPGLPGRAGLRAEAPPALQVRTLHAAAPAPPPALPQPAAAAPTPRHLDAPQAAHARPAPAAAAPASVAAPAAPSSASSPGAAAPPGEPPPPAVPPTDMRLHYRVVRGEAQGQGDLVLAQDGEGGYTLTLHAQVPGMAELDWRSTGRVTPDGLAPLRLEERRRGRTVRAVNFQRDKGLISYSGPTRTDALLPGAQDRLSLLVQLPALRRAAPARDEWVVQVAAPGGTAEVWRFAVREEAAATVLTREPERPYDWRLELTVPAQAPQWPLRMVWTLLPGGQPIEWALDAAP